MKDKTFHMSLQIKYLPYKTRVHSVAVPLYVIYILKFEVLGLGFFFFFFEPYFTFSSWKVVGNLSYKTRQGNLQKFKRKQYYKTHTLILLKISLVKGVPVGASTQYCNFLFIYTHILQTNHSVRFK